MKKLSLWRRTLAILGVHQANDDKVNTDESTLNVHDHIFSTDKPGWPSLSRVLPVGTKVMYRGNFEEFIRFSFFARPESDGTLGSRGSDFFYWKSKLKGEWDGTVWSRIGGLGPGTENDIAEGDEAIPEAP